MLFWIPFAFLVVSLVGSTAWAGTRGLRLWRTFRRVSGRLTTSVERVSEAGAQAERRASSLTANSERLSAAVARLQESLARLAVLRAAFAESRTTFGSARRAVPRK